MGMPVSAALALGLEPNPGVITLAALVGFICWQPFWEELLFRGVIQSWCLRRAWGTRKLACVSHANLLTSALFSLSHAFNHSLPWAIAVFAPSLVFGHLRERGESIWPAVATHASYNAMLLAALHWLA